MGLLRRIVTAPITAPLDGALWVAGKIHEAAEQEVNDPAAIRAALARLEADLLAGRLSEEAYDTEEEALLIRLQGLGG